MRLKISLFFITMQRKMPFSYLVAFLDINGTQSNYYHQARRRYTQYYIALTHTHTRFLNPSQHTYVPLQIQRSACTCTHTHESNAHKKKYKQAFWVHVWTCVCVCAIQILPSSMYHTRIHMDKCTHTQGTLTCTHVCT